MSNSIHISELSKEISNVVKSYSKEVELEAGEATELVAKSTVQFSIITYLKIKSYLECLINILW